MSGARTRALTLAGGLLLAGLCAAAPGEVPTSAASAPCAAAPFGLLDFWVGEFDVYAGETLAGRDRIVKILGGCAIEEHWVNAQGAEGRSLFYVVPAEGVWKQVWVTASVLSPGGVKEKRLVATHEDGSVVFEGEVPLVGGGAYRDRTTLSPMAGGRVRQLIERSMDAGASWQATFDAVYVPADAEWSRE